MAEQFNFQRLTPFNFLRDNSSQNTDKHLFTHSEVSHEHFLEELLQPQIPFRPYYPEKEIVQSKEKNKRSAKRYRDKKKQEFQTMKQQIYELQQENTQLKSQKYCRWCRKSYASNIMIEKTSIAEPIQPMTVGNSKGMDIQFEKPDFGRKRQIKSGKIWIALGLLMLVLGLTIHGFTGEKSTIKEIELQKSQRQRWIQQYNERQKEDYFKVKMKLKEGPSSHLDQKEELKILYRSPTERDPSPADHDEISINKELLYGIHAELQDIGMYL